MPYGPRSSTAGWRAVRANRTGVRVSAARAAGNSRSAPAGPSPTTTIFGTARPVRWSAGRGRRLGRAGGGQLERHDRDLAPVEAAVTRVDSDVDLARVRSQLGGDVADRGARLEVDARDPSEGAVHA